MPVSLFFSDEQYMGVQIHFTATYILYRVEPQEM
uniref:Uncharacterized protein n=1 Tax=Moniliophthora roreri TaxID=221103 RepID=A0A0W0FYT4_MONRR